MTIQSIIMENHAHHTLTPTKIIRKLSHSSIILHHLPHHHNHTHKEAQAQDGQGNEEAAAAGAAAAALSPLWRKYVGIFLALAASLTISSVTLIVKHLSGNYDPISLVLWRLQGVLFPSLLFLCARGAWAWGRRERGEQEGGITIKSPCTPPDRDNRNKWRLGALLAARGILGCSADIFQFFSLKYLTLGDSSVIIFSSPIFVTIVAHFTLGEKMGLVQLFCGALSLAGVGIMSRPPLLTGAKEFDEDVLIGNAYAFLCMLFTCSTIIVLRSLRSLHFSLTTASFGFFGTVETLLLLQFCGSLGLSLSADAEPDAAATTLPLPHGSDWAYVGGIAVLYFIGQLFFTLSLQLEDASIVALIRSCDVLFAFLLQFVFLGEAPDVWSLTGGAFVLLGVGVTAARKYIQELPHEGRGKLQSCLLF